MGGLGFGQQEHRPRVFVPLRTLFLVIYVILFFCFFFQGMLFALSDCAKLPVELVRLWRHESERVYKDKLIDKSDMELYEKLSRDVIKKSFEVG